ncbi:hypothetical protein M407DRAFT_246804 [Tulasnella calospora MUT 4182]|uniref:Uncharacterized protein n=1 Tax=Tulasnella calospora MUT 4182 TaxID=1051891 RepID=A0A0C3K769_9AGAM|nr:hypothetical protein M407DRAFT_246804 [Tulasnella calospora MUT 4182]
MVLGDTKAAAARIPRQENRANCRHRPRVLNSTKLSYIKPSPSPPLTTRTSPAVVPTRRGTILAWCNQSSGSHRQPEEAGFSRIPKQDRKATLTLRVLLPYLLPPPSSSSLSSTSPTEHLPSSAARCSSLPPAMDRPLKFY